MTCHEARDWLSAYVDDTLAPEERTRVESHLASCPDCRRELASLRQTVALLQRVQPARAPVGFVDRVVAAARPRPWYRRIADAVLLPLTVKLPLEVTAALMVGLLAVFLFERTPELQQAARQDAPGPEAPGVPVPALRREPAAVARPAPPLADESVRSTPEAEAPAGAPAPPRAAGERDRRDAPASRDAARPAGPPPAPAPPAAGPAATVPPPSEARPAPERKELPGANVGATARQELETRSRAFEHAAEPGRPAAPSAPRLAAKRVAPAADVVTSVAVKDRDAAERDLAALIARVGGSVAQRRSEADATVVEALIPQPRYAEFSEGLTRIGAWQVEAERPDLPAQIRVILRLQ